MAKRVVTYRHISHRVLDDGKKKSKRGLDDNEVK